MLRKEWQGVLAKTMESARKRSGSITFLLVGLVLLVVAGTVAFAPVITCPEYCSDADVAEPGSSRNCPRCKGHGRITLVESWRYQYENRHLAPLMTDDGKVIAEVSFRGFTLRQALEAQNIFGLKKNDRLTRTRVLHARDRLLKVESFRNVEFETRPDASGDKNRLIIAITLVPSGTKEQNTLSEEKLNLPEQRK